MKMKMMKTGLSIVVLASAVAVAMPVSAIGQQSTGDKIEDGAKKAATATKEGLSKTGEVMTDAWVTSRIHGRFITADLLKGSDIDVDVNNHVVTLNGTVTSAAGRAKAEQIAMRTEGVHRVINHLKIAAKASH